MYLAWASLYEGSTDAAYFDVLVPKIMEDLLAREAQRTIDVPILPAVRLGLESRSIDDVARELCNEREAFHVLFFHTDTGGRGLESGIANRREALLRTAFELCGWPPERTAFLSPRHETEAWVLADAYAVCRALGYKGHPSEIGLPRTAKEAERLVDPKLTLLTAARKLSKRAYQGGAGKLLAVIAQEQDVSVLRGCASFRAFEDTLIIALRSVGCI